MTSFFWVPTAHGSDRASNPHSVGLRVAEQLWNPAQPERVADASACTTAVLHAAVDRPHLVELGEVVLDGAYTHLRTERDAFDA